MQFVVALNRYRALADQWAASRSYSATVDDARVLKDWTAALTEAAVETRQKQEQVNHQFYKNVYGVIVHCEAFDTTYVLVVL
jgi:hypothetical protein